MADRTEDEGALELIPLPAIQKRIVVVRKRHVMVDEDLAELYGVQTGRLIQQVKRNIDRFPSDFMFKLTKDEAAALEIAICNLKRRARRTSLRPLRLHRARRGNAVRRSPKSHGGRRQHRDHAGVR